MTVPPQSSHPPNLTCQARSSDECNRPSGYLARRVIASRYLSIYLYTAQRPPGRLPRSHGWRLSKTWGDSFVARKAGRGERDEVRVAIELTRGDGAIHCHEAFRGNDDSSGSAVSPLGLTLPDAKAVLAGMQRHVVQAQVADCCRDRCCCPHYQEQRPLKHIRTRWLSSMFGTVEVHGPRFKPCRCSVTSRRTFAPMAEIMPNRCTTEYECIVSKLGARMPYRRARGFLAEFFPVGEDEPEVETIRQPALRVGARLERDAVSPTTSLAPVPPARAMTVSIDGGHVRSAHGHKVRTFEVFAALVGNHYGQEIVFSSVPAEADKQQCQLRGVLQGLGVTPRTPVTVLSDGAAGPRTSGEAASDVHSAMFWIASTSPCASSTSPSASRAGRTRRLRIVRQAPTSLTVLKTSIGVYGMARCDVR